MDRTVHDTMISCGWKLQTLLRSGRTSRELVNLYKAHILSFIEYMTSAIDHASDIVLKGLDDRQGRKLRIVHATKVDALIHFNLVPLSARRDIAMLGLIHPAAIGQGPAQLMRFFHLNCQVKTCNVKTRWQESRHSAELHED